MSNKTATPKSKLHAKWGGMLVFSGLQGLGKSDLAFRAERPELTGVIDFDLKGETMAKEYGIKNFWQPIAFMKPDMDPTEYDRAKIAEWAVDKLVNLPELTTLVIDNAPAMEAGLSYLVEQNPAKYGLNAENVRAGRYGGANPGISILWQNLTAYLKNQKGVKLIIMINHMTPPWADGKPVPNRFHVKGNKIFRQLSAGTFILTPGDAARGGTPPVPAALVVKESLANRKWDEAKEEHVLQRTIPHRFPIADWKLMTAYFTKPADFKNPAVGETWLPKEVDAYGEFLSPETLQWIRDTAKINFDDGEGGGGGTGKDALAAGRAKLLAELKPHGYKDLNEVAAVVKQLGLTYSLKEHDKIRARLIEAKKLQKEQQQAI